MIAARVDPPSRILPSGSIAAVAVVYLAALGGATLGCATMKAGRKSSAGATATTADAGPRAAATGAGATTAETSRATTLGGGGDQPREIARAPLGALSASKWRLRERPDGGADARRVGDQHQPTRPGSASARATRTRRPGETGLAHLFEHLMFTQTKGQPVGAFDREIEAVGGNANAMTYYDFTAYVDDVPPGELARVAAPRGGSHGQPRPRKRQVDNERDVVAEERLASVEDSVDGSLDEMMYKQAFSRTPTAGR